MSGIKKETTDPGCRVELSDFGKRMQSQRGQGVVVSYRSFLGSKTDGEVMVQWDDKKKPSGMHISQIKKA